MTTTNFCRCGHPADSHWWAVDGRAVLAKCAGQSRINEAHPDYEDCACREYRPRPEPQGRML